MRATAIFPSIRQMTVASKAKSGGSPLSAKTLKESLQIFDDISKNVKAEDAGKTYYWQDVCARSSIEADCRSTSAASVLLGTGVDAQTRLTALADFEAAGANLSVRSSFIAGGLSSQS